MDVVTIGQPFLPIFRYNSFLPYDHNRVCLKKVIEDDDYINASWINEENNGLTEKLLIASQGPLPNTIVHFLQMIVEQKVEVVVMLCLPNETNKQGNLIDIYQNKTESPFSLQLYNAAQL